MGATETQRLDSVMHYSFCLHHCNDNGILSPICCTSIKTLSEYLYSEPWDNRIIKKTFVAALNPELKWRLGSADFLCSSQIALWCTWGVFPSDTSGLLSLLFREKHMFCLGLQPPLCHPFNTGTELRLCRRVKMLCDLTFIPKLP